LLHDLLARLLRHDRIAEDQIEGLLLELAHAVGAVARRLDLVAAGLEDGADDRANVVFIVDDENASQTTALPRFTRRQPELPLYFPKGDRVHPLSGFCHGFVGRAASGANGSLSGWSRRRGGTRIAAG